MRALTLYQPWADAIAFGWKRIETRSWATSYRGPLLIHAGKTIDREFLKDEARWCQDNLHGRRDVLEPRCYRTLHDWWMKIPRGAVVAVATLAECRRTESFEDVFGSTEFMWGNFEVGRWGWVLEGVQMLARPIPCKGEMGLWTPSSSIIEQVQTQMVTARAAGEAGAD